MAFPASWSKQGQKQPRGVGGSLPPRVSGFWPFCPGKAGLVGLFGGRGGQGGVRFGGGRGGGGEGGAPPRFRGKNGELAGNATTSKVSL